ncbi:hypothetical protein F2Q70_00026753 [Brassica cretica]|uniref:Uncharacterized protein n=1 Tax=Brassica cretica TaxID=69181 RepID=A0A8S9L8W2_BRACR|nr:hypothetical protein F2Q70_00026753 [Brassica cretica]
MFVANKHAADKGILFWPQQFSLVYVSPVSPAPKRKFDSEATEILVPPSCFSAWPSEHQPTTSMCILLKAVFLTLLPAMVMMVMMEMTCLGPSQSKLLKSYRFKFKDKLLLLDEEAVRVLEILQAVLKKRLEFLENKARESTTGYFGNGFHCFLISQVFHLQRPPEPVFKEYNDFGSNQRVVHQFWKSTTSTSEPFPTESLLEFYVEQEKGIEADCAEEDGGDASPAFASGKQATSRKEESSWESTLLLLDEKLSLAKTSSPLRVVNDVDHERKIIKAPKAGDKASKEAIEISTEVSVDGGDASPAFASGKQAISRKEESSWESTLLLLDEKFSLAKTSSPESSTSDMVEEIYVTADGSE